MPRISFLSDLHLFARRSTADQYHDQIVEAARESDVCILGGDIFDFRWSVYRTEDETAHAAVEWLRKFDEETNHCRVHFLLGNHDDHPELLQRLPYLAEELKTFEWSRYYYRLGDTFFLHGDVADKTMTAACLESQRQSFAHGNRTELHNKLYDVAIKAQLHRLAPPAVYPCKRVAARILSYLESIGNGKSSGVEHVYFGHTHRPMDHYLYKGIHFHNGGAPIGRAPFRILKRDIPTDSPNGPVEGIDSHRA
ncbi:Calcineurin-like phosphoesterase superfamily domain protein [Thalassoglobus neptunius]|uniref:Calcineurin-like phosphoesterase superfamily domain protein n=1 Tax=Thalassoglobus neptunius TaxID=1938619 RepID=A0A5C5X0C9_9PLAN|nr:metallophosphoesterase [Thalassoglobus neptunius]TWT55613.1 Calcineurin-like phosphoesterase superfamily domain protein [Thalassoglobus neptunius]